MKSKLAISTAKIRQKNIQPIEGSIGFEMPFISCEIKRKQVRGKNESLIKRIIAKERPKITVIKITPETRKVKIDGGIGVPRQLKVFMEYKIQLKNPKTDKIINSTLKSDNGLAQTTKHIEKLYRDRLELISITEIL